MARATSPVVIGRDQEMARLERAVDGIKADGPAVALVAGEAGVGKTRLVDGFVAEARRRGVRVGTANCIDLGETIFPLAPVRDLVAGVIDGLDDEAAGLVLGPARAALARLLPELGDVPLDAPAISSEQLCELVIGVFDRATRRGPLVLVVEDLHWADATTRMMLTALGRGGPRRPLLLVGTFRDDELHRRHPLRPLLAELERRTNCERIAVRPLDRWETGLLIEALDPAPAGRALVEEVHHRGGGNPFYIEELVAARRAGVTTVPDALRDVVLAHTATLADDDVIVLGALAAAGVASAELLAEVTRLDAEQLRATLVRLRATALLAGGEVARFRHELAREVCYDELVPGERTRLHARLAAGLEALSPHRLGEIAYHWSAARNAERALSAAVAAGRQALATGAAAEAEGHFARALDLWDGVPDAAGLVGMDHAGLLVETAAAAKLGDRLDRGIELSLRAAAELAGRDPLREAEVWLDLRDAYAFATRFQDCNDALARALEIVPTDWATGTRARALADAAMRELWEDRPASGLALAREAVAIAEQVGDSAIVIHAHNILVSAFGHNDQPEDALAAARANVDRCRATTPPDVVLSAHDRLVGCLMEASRWADVAVAAERGVGIALSVGLAGPFGSSMAFSWLDALGLLGRWAEAEALLPQIVQLFDAPTIAGYLGQCWGMILVRQGRIDEARPLVEETRSALAATDWPFDRPWNVGAVALFDAADGQPDHAVQLVDEQFSRPDADVAGGEATLLSIGIEILADVELTRKRPDPEASARAVRTAERWADHVIAPGRRAPAQPDADAVERQQSLAHLDRLRRRSDPERWAVVADGWRRLGFRFEEAAARFHCADATLARSPRPSKGDRGAAKEHLDRARQIAAALPAPPLLARIDDLARRARLGVDSSANRRSTIRGDGVALTTRERDVLERLARGRTNGQIAAELFISTKAASVHVSNILRKLGVANRVEAAERARTMPNEVDLIERPLP